MVLKRACAAIGAAFALLLMANADEASPGATPVSKAVAEKIDWPAFMARHDMMFECNVGDKRITLHGQDTQIVALSDRQSMLSQELNRIAAGRPVTSSPVEADPYSGVATIPADINLATSRIYIELDAISPEEAAAISINGKPAGGFICRPFRLDVTRFLKPGDNRVEVVPFAPKTVKLSVYP